MKPFAGLSIKEKIFGFGILSFLMLMYSLIDLILWFIFWPLGLIGAIFITFGVSNMLFGDYTDSPY